MCSYSRRLLQVPKCLVPKVPASSRAPLLCRLRMVQYRFPGGPMMQQQDKTIRERLREQLQERAQRGQEENSDQDGYRYGGGMMDGGMMGRGMMHRRYGYHDSDRGVMRPPMMMRMIFSLMDADGDGKLSLQEFQAAHERIFKAMITC